MKFTHALDCIVFHYFGFLLRWAALHWQLIEVSKQLVFLNQDFTIVSNCNSCLIVSINLVLIYLRKAWATANNTTSLVLVYLVVWDVSAAVEENDSVTVVIDLVVLDPAEPCFDAEDALGPRLIDKIIQDHRVSWVIASICNVCFIVLKYFILLDVATSWVHK